MSGETEAEVSGWTTDTLHSLIMRLLAERDRRYDERDRRYEERFEAQEKAVETANTANEKRLDSVNEFRAQQTDLLNRFMPREETEQRINQVDQKTEALDRRHNADVSVINSRLDVREGTSSGVSASVGYLFAAVAASASIALIISLIAR